MGLKIFLKYSLSCRVTFNLYTFSFLVHEYMFEDLSGALLCLVAEGLSVFPWNFLGFFFFFSILWWKVILLATIAETFSWRILCLISDILIANLEL